MNAAPDTFLEVGTEGDRVLVRVQLVRPWILRWLPRRRLNLTMPPATARRVAASLNQAAAKALHRRGQ